METKWTRSLLKQNAWQNLKNYYWPALGVCLLGNVMGANGGGGGSGYSGGSSFSDYAESSSGSDGSDLDPTFIIAMVAIFVFVFLFAMAIGLAISCFVGNPAKCGQCKYFVTARNGDAKFTHMFDNFKGGNYMPTVKTMFFYTLEIMLWTLLFIIPGVIKSYEYALVPYIVAENPRIDRKRAKEISSQTMNGEKMDFFVLRLSFLGWYLLGYLACCIGVIFVQPYQLATEAEFYMCMRAKMLSYGYTSEEELTGGFYNGMGGGSSDMGGGSSYIDPNFTNDAYSVPNSDPYASTNTNNYNNTTNYNNAAPTNPNDAYNGVMPGIGDDQISGSNFNDPNNPYNQ